MGSRTANAVMVQYNYRERGSGCSCFKPSIENGTERPLCAPLRAGGAMPLCRGAGRRIDLTGIDCIIVDECHFMNAAQVRQLVGYRR